MVSGLAPALLWMKCSLLRGQGKAGPIQQVQEKICSCALT